MDENYDAVLSPNELDLVLLALITGRRGRHISDSDIDRTVRWARKTRIGTVLLDLVLDGSIVIDIRADGELVFKMIDDRRN